MFSKACEYGIRSMLEIAKQSSEGQRVGLKAIAHATESPEAFTAKILQTLTKAKLLTSSRGPSGGFSLSEDQLQQITLAQVVRAIDGDEIFTGCALGLKECNPNKPCPLHDKFLIIREDLAALLETTSLFMLLGDLKLQHTYLKR